jgi:hypothetical protein
MGHHYVDQVYPAPNDAHLFKPDKKDEPSPIKKHQQREAYWCFDIQRLQAKAKTLIPTQSSLAACR